jgi:NAD(P)-dependent dehydrogenase (short-subunit alcohol dehydrogenase family)
MLAAGAEEAGKELEVFLEEVAAESPNGRIATPEDVAALILFLASDAAAHITGTAIPVDGGLTA